MEKPKNTQLNPPRGTYDALPAQSARLNYIETTARAVLGRYGYGEIRTPMFESTEVFTRNVGEATDIVSKEMYVFDDKGGDSMALRPEGTAPVVRAYYSNKLKHSLPLKLMYVGAPMFRYERPQKGRFRQFHQIGVEVLGIADAWADVEVIAAGVAMLNALGLTGLEVRLNTLGTNEDRETYRSELLKYFEPIKSKLSAESQERLQKNPLRVLDSKQREDQEFIPNAPKPTDFLSAESQAFYENVKQGLTALGIKFVEEPTLVRGLDYYSHTVFELHSTALGAQSQVLSGGRYDGMFAQMGNENVPAVGWGSGVERLEMLLEKTIEPITDIAFVVEDDTARITALQLAEKLRTQGKTVAVPLSNASMKAQFKRADKLSAKEVYVLGERELAAGEITVKNMENGEQKTISEKEIK